jgi:hypothetical protein
MRPSYIIYLNNPLEYVGYTQGPYTFFKKVNSCYRTFVYESYNMPMKNIKFRLLVDQKRLVRFCE